MLRADVVRGGPDEAIVLGLLEYVRGPATGARQQAAAWRLAQIRGIVRPLPANARWPGAANRLVSARGPCAPRPDARKHINLTLSV